MPEHTYDLFLSYAQADAPWVRSYFTPALGLPADRLIQAADFRPGYSLYDELERAVKNSRYTLLILTPAFLADQWASMGEQLAAYLGAGGQAERIIPLILQPCELPLRIDFRVKLDCTEQDEWDNQVARLRGIFELTEPGEEDIPCPYPGMVPFTADDARFFYGREDEIEFMLQHMRHQKFLLVVGPSGSGKSSLITAGLLPRLEASGFFRKRPWLVRRMRPGASPWESLQKALGGDPDDIDKTLSDLLAANPGSGRLLLVVDQFEEVLTQPDQVVERRFISAVKRLREHDSASVIVAMRADFYGDLLGSDLWPVDPSQRLDVGPLKGDALRRAIEKPAEDSGVFIETRLVDRLIADASDAPGALPLLQETLLQLWSHRLRRFLPYSAYAALGGKGNGVAAAIAQKADATMAQLADPTCGDQDIARRIFLRLVQFGEGRADTRRQQTVGALHAADEREGAFDLTLNHLSDGRLISLSAGNEQDGEDKVDIAHEALFQGWPALSGWIVKYREHELLRRQLDARAVDWNAHARSNERLLNRVQLAQASEWLAKPEAQHVGHSAELTDLVTVSRRYHRRSRVTRVVIMITGTFLAVALALVWGLGQRANAQYQEQVASLERENVATAEAGRVAEGRARATAEANRLLALRNESRAWAELASQNLGTDPVASLVWSSRALPSPDNQRPAEAYPEYELRLALQQSLERKFVDVAPGPADADGPLVAVGGNALVLWPHDLGGRLKQFPGRVDKLRWHTDGSLYAYTGNALTVWRNDVAFRYDLSDSITAAAWRPHLPELAVVSGSTVSRWAYATGDPETLAVLPGSVEVRERFAPLAWSANGESLAVWDRSGALLIYGAELPGDPPTTTLTLPQPVTNAAWSPDGRTLVALLSDGSGLVLSGDMAVEAGQVFTPTVAGDASGTFGGLAFLDATHFLTWGRSAAPKLWSVDDLSAAAWSYPLQVGAVAGIDVAPDGTRFAAFGENGDIDVFRVDGEMQWTLRGHDRFAVLAEWNGDLLATGGSDGTVQVWALGDEEEPPPSAVLHAVREGTGLGRSYVTALEWQEGGRLLSVAEDGSARIWQVLDGDGQPLCSGGWTEGPTRTVCAADGRALRGHEERLDSLRWLDGNALLSTDRAGGARRWDLRSGETRLVPGDPEGERHALWSPDGALVFSYGTPEGIDDPGDGVIWDALRGARVATVEGPVRWAHWSELGLIVKRDGSDLISVGPATGRDVNRYPGAPAAEQITEAATSGQQLAVASKDGSIYVWTGPGTKPAVLTQDRGSPVGRLAWSADGSQLLGAGGRVVLWNLRDGSPAWRSFEAGLGSCRSAFSPDGRYVAGCIDSQVYVWDAATSTTLWQALSSTEVARGVAWHAAPTFDGTGTRFLLLTWAGNVAQLWDWGARALIGEYRVAPELNLASISPDGGWLATTDDAGEIRLWNLSLGDPQVLLQTAADRITRKVDK